jgi:hypothetical protein
LEKAEAEARIQEDASRSVCRRQHFWSVGREVERKRPLVTTANLAEVRGPVARANW